MSGLAIALLLVGGALVGNWLHGLDEKALIWSSVAFMGAFLGACLMGLL